MGEDGHPGCRRSSQWVRVVGPEQPSGDSRSPVGSASGEVGLAAVVEAVAVEPSGEVGLAVVAEVVAVEPAGIEGMPAGNAGTHAFLPFPLGDTCFDTFS